MVGRSVTWAVDGLVGWLMASLVCRSVGNLVLVASLWIGWLLVLVRRSVSHLDDRSIGELDCLVGWMVGG